MAKPLKKPQPKRKPVVRKKKPQTKPNVAAVVPVQAESKPRRLSVASYKANRLHNRITHHAKLSNVWQLTKTTAIVLWEHKRLFITITLIYGVLNLLLVRGLAGGTNVGDLKHQLSTAFTGNVGALASSLSIFVVLVGSSGNASSQTAGAYQLFLALIVSLAVIWALRQTMAGVRLRARDAYYKGMYPLIPFILVLLVLALQLIPLLIGSALYSTVINNGIAVYFAEKLLWGAAFALLATLTFYMLSSSLFALYIVTLPDMTPMKALRSARQLVRFRRWTVLRKILFLPLLLLLSAGLIMVPIIIVATPFAQWVFFLLTMFSLVAIHAYMYTLYRELLDE